MTRLIPMHVFLQPPPPCFTKISLSAYISVDHPSHRIYGKTWPYHVNYYQNSVNDAFGNIDVGQIYHVTDEKTSNKS